MPGALANAFQPDPQQTQAPQRPGYAQYAASSNPDAVNDPYVASALAAQSGALGQPDNTFAQQQADFASGLRGQGSPTDQLGALQRGRDAAAAQKAASIQRAMMILQATQANQSSNLPLIAAAGAMLQPTRSGGFAESLGKGFEASVPVAQQERTRQLQMAGAEGQLGVEAAGLPLQTSQEDVSDFWNRMKMAEQAGQGAAIVGGRSAVAQTNAGARLGSAGIAAGSRENVAQTNAGARTESAGIAAGAHVEGEKIRGSDAATINSQSRLAATQARIAASVDAREAAAKLKQMGIDAQTQNNIMNNATRAASTDPAYLTGKKPLSAYVQEQVQGRGGQPPAGASPPAGVSPAPAAPAAPPPVGQPRPSSSASPAPAQAQPGGQSAAKPAPDLSKTGGLPVGTESINKATGQKLMWTGMQWLELTPQKPAGQ